MHQAGADHGAHAPGLSYSRMAQLQVVWCPFCRLPQACSSAKEGYSSAALKNDFSNAFNACARQRMVEQLLKSPFGHFEPAFRLFYEHAGALYFEGERLSADSC